MAEHERSEINLACQLDEAFQGRHAGIEDDRPWFDMCNILKPVRQCLQQFRLLA